MSCFMMDERAISVLSNTLESVMNSGFNRFGFEAPESLHKALSDCRDHYGFYLSEKIFIYNLIIFLFAKLIKHTIFPIVLKITKNSLIL